MAGTIGICAVYIIVALTGMTLIKSGYDMAPLFHVPLVGVGISLRTLVGVGLYGISFLIYMLFVSRMKISIAVPVVSGIYCALTAVVGFFVFNERMTAGQIAGIVLIVIGTVLVGVMKKTS